MGLRKHINLADYALGNILKFRVRSAVIVISLVVAASLLCSVEFIHEGVVMDIRSSAAEGPDIVVQRLVGGRQTIVPNQWKDNVSRTPGVSIATSRVWGYSDIGSGVLLTVMGINATEYSNAMGAVGNNMLQDGRFLNDSDRLKIVVGQGIVDIMKASAARIDIVVGSKLSLISSNGSLIEFEIIGIFASDSSAYSYDMIITDQTSARLLLGIDNSSCTDIAVWTTHGSSTNEVALKLDNSIVGGRILTREAITNELLKTYGGRAGITALLWAVLLLTVIFQAFTVSSAGSDEARREVGLLKALGFDTIDVLEVRMFESLILGVLGASLGVSLAIIYDYILGAPILSGYLLGWGLHILNAGIPLSMSPATIFVVYSVAIIPILVASVVPAWKNAITEPDSVLRGV